MHPTSEPSAFIHWFRSAAPYINAHRGRTFVIQFGGETVADSRFPSLIHDIAQLHSLGIRLVLVYGIRPQVEERLKARGLDLHYAEGMRATTADALVSVKDAAGTCRTEIEALLSMGLANSPMAGANVRAVSGNFVTARPVGVRGGVDFGHTGLVRRVDAEAIRHALGQGGIVILPPLGYSPTGEVFNLAAGDVAAAVTAALGADKLLCLVDGAGLTDAGGTLLRELTLAEAEELAKKGVAEELERVLEGALTAIKAGVRRVHLVNRHTEGALLLELFSRDGIGTLITAGRFEETRKAAIDDVGGMLELITPLEAAGVLVHRSRDRLEAEIANFMVMERDGMITACAALYPFADEQVGELACLAVHADYRRTGRAAELLAAVERAARAKGIRRLFVLTTQTAHWFQERGFVAAGIDHLPVARQRMYNYQRNAKVFIKSL